MRTYKHSNDDTDFIIFKKNIETQNNNIKLLQKKSSFSSADQLCKKAKNSEISHIEGIYSRSNSNL